MHAKMVLVMFGTLFAGQILLFLWRKKHPRSYNAATLLGNYTHTFLTHGWIFARNVTFDEYVYILYC